MVLVYTIIFRFVLLMVGKQREKPDRSVVKWSSAGLIAMQMLRHWKCWGSGRTEKCSPLLMVMTLSTKNLYINGHTGFNFDLVQTESGCLPSDTIGWPAEHMFYHGLYLSEVSIKTHVDL